MKTKDKILFIIHFPPPIHGSAVIGGYIKESRVINDFFDCRYINLGLSESVHEIGSSGIKKIYKYFFLVLKVLKNLIFNRPDICYFTLTAQGPGFFKDAPIVLLAKMFGIKTLFHFHNKGITTHDISFFEDILHRMVFHKSEVILISKKLYYDFCRYLPEAKVHYCTNGIPEEAMNSHPISIDAPNLTAIPQKPCELLFLSNLTESKGVFILIDACEILKKRNLNFHCTLIGGEGDITVHQIEEMIKRKEISSVISYQGKKIGKEKELSLKSADIFVHPTYSDCLPLVLLEAVKNSLPVVSTFEGAIPDIIEDGINGYLVEPRDAFSLAEKLEILIKDPILRKRMGQEGRRIFEKDFSLNIFEKNMVNVLKEVLK